MIYFLSATVFEKYKLLTTATTVFSSGHHMKTSFFLIRHGMETSTRCYSVRDIMHVSDPRHASTQKQKQKRCLRLKVMLWAQELLLENKVRGAARRPDASRGRQVLRPGGTVRTVVSRQSNDVAHSNKQMHKSTRTTTGRQSQNIAAIAVYNTGSNVVGHRQPMTEEWQVQSKRGPWRLADAT